MTVSSKVKQTIASIKGAQADLESFALETQNQNAKQIFADAAQQIKNVMATLEPRIMEMENQEPQYRGF